MSKNKIIIIFLMLLSFSFNGNSEMIYNRKNASMELCNITAVEFKEAKWDDHVLIDVRTRGEFEQGHLQGALLFDIYKKDFVDRVKTLDPGKKYIVYCKTGSRSYHASRYMAQMGFQYVCNLKGGIIQLQQVGVPFVK